MKLNILISFIFIVILSSCRNEQKVYFDSASLNQNVYQTNDEVIDIQSILKKHEGQKIIIEIWASWCADCIKSLPEIAEFQEKHPEIQFVFISVDDTAENWKNGIAKQMDKFEIKGEQYFFNTGWDKNGENHFIDYIQLNWIPRFMLINESGKIVVFNAKDIKSSQLQNQIY